MTPYPFPPQVIYRLPVGTTSSATPGGPRQAPGSTRAEENTTGLRIKYQLGMRQPGECPQIASYTLCQPKLPLSTYMKTISMSPVNYELIHYNTCPLSIFQ